MTLLYFLFLLYLSIDLDRRTKGQSESELSDVLADSRAIDREESICNHHRVQAMLIGKKVQRIYLLIVRSH